MASRAHQSTASLDVALVHAERLIERDPALALTQVGEVLGAVPDHPQAILLAGRAHRRAGRSAEAHALLSSLSTTQPRSAVTALELGLTCRTLGKSEAAVASFRSAVTLKPDFVEAWQALADQLHLIGDEAGADKAFLAALSASVADPELATAALALREGRLRDAEPVLRARLRRRPTEIAAIRMLAEVAARLGRNSDAAKLLERCLALSPGFDAARQGYAAILQRLNRSEDALIEIERLLAKDARNPAWRMVKAAILSRLGASDEAITLYQPLLDEYPAQPKGWMSYGHALKTVGRQAEAIAAYLKSIALAPTLGEAWWSLANLKTYRFDATALAAMTTALDAANLDDEDRLHLHFAIGKALEDAREDDAAFAHYAEGNAIRAAQIGYDARRTTDSVARAIALFDGPFLAERTAAGCSAPDPIFIVGLPRAGSTLIEQILASHPLVEGTMELPDVPDMANRLADGREGDYPEILSTLSREDFRALGEEYLRRTRIQRRTDRPFFIDKMPNNWLHCGLITLILPNAKIIDARRHPLDGCFSAFKQHFARGQGFSYSLDDVGRYYRDYTALMAHFDRVMPGRIHRVIYERMIENTEAQIRALLTHCGLPFDAACLTFWQTDRAVRTASSEQVRRPINRDGADRWRRFERHLGPLKSALGPVLNDWSGLAQRV